MANIEEHNRLDVVASGAGAIQVDDLRLVIALCRVNITSAICLLHILHLKSADISYERYIIVLLVLYWPM